MEYSRESGFWEKKMESIASNGIYIVHSSGLLEYESSFANQSLLVNDEITRTVLNGVSASGTYPTSTFVLLLIR